MAALSLGNKRGKSLVPRYPISISKSLKSVATLKEPEEFLSVVFAWGGEKKKKEKKVMKSKAIELQVSAL